MVNAAEAIRIYPWATDTAGCFYQRLKMPLDALERKYPGEFEVCWSCEPKPWSLESAGIRSVVVGQRIMGNGAEPDPRWMAYCNDPGFMAVYEIDDDIIDLDQDNRIPYDIFTPNRLGTATNITYADHLITSTPNLATKLHEYIRDGLEDRTTVAPNCVADGFVVERDPDRGGRDITIGWAGSMFHQQDFPPELVGQLAAVRDDHPDVRWVSIGANYLGWGSTFGWGPIDRYHARLPFLDIGIAPISRTPFNASKSWIKALDYMAKGVVPVVEDWGQYPELIGDGDAYVGLTAGTYADWYSYLSKAIIDLRAGLFSHRAIAARAREFEISNQVHRWAEVFRKARIA